MCVLILAVLASTTAATADPVDKNDVEYDVSFPNAVHHEAEIRVTFHKVTTDPLEVRMSRSSPGRYRLHEFARNVYSVRAVDSGGKELEIERPNPHQWNVAGHDGTVKLTYTLFADQVSGTYSAIDATHAHLNGPATFMWARGMTDRAVRVALHRPQPDWKVATQLVETDDPGVFTGSQYAVPDGQPDRTQRFRAARVDRGGGRDGPAVSSCHAPRRHGRRSRLLRPLGGTRRP